jgi:putative flippase GtrA
MINDEHSKIVKFIIAGVCKVVSGYIVYLLVLWIGLHYSLALAADYVFGVSIGYVVNRYWTFSSQGRPKAAFFKYIVTYVVVFVLELMTLNLAIQAGMSSELGRIPSLVCATVAAYVLQRHWAFKGH